MVSHDKKLQNYAEQIDITNNTALAIIVNCLQGLGSSNPVERFYAERFIERPEESEYSLKRCCTILGLDYRWVQQKIFHTAKLIYGGDNVIPSK